MSEFPEFPPYKLDIYFPEWHIAIEVDGPFHSNPRDKSRDAFLREMYGVIILRIKTKRWITESKIQSAIKAFIEENGGPESVTERKVLWQTRR